jgi:hypothetical protein
VDVHCSRRCTVAARMTLRGRRGRRAVLRTRSRSFEGSGRLSAQLSKRLARRLGRERRVAVARIEAKGPAGERAAAVLRPARRGR